ncbi:MAG: hypothetical protein U0790_24045 [Isosphaeraceae bacterium]
MREDQPHNVAIAEVEHKGQVARITGSAATEDDDAIGFIVDLMAQQGIPGDRVLRLYSERQPSPEWQDYFAAHWPNAAITWSFAPGEEATLDAAVNELLGGAKKPWWRFW